MTATIRVESGTYIVTSTIHMKSNVRMVGATTGYCGPIATSASFIKLANGANVTLMDCAAEDADAQTKQVTIENIWFNGNNTNQTSVVDTVDFSNGRYCHFVNNYFENAKRTALIARLATIERNFFQHSDKFAADLITDCKFIANEVSGGCNDAAYVGNGAVSSRTGANIITDNFVYLCANGHGIESLGVKDIIANNRVHNNYGVGIFCSAVTDVVIANNMLFANSVHGATAYSDITLENNSTKCVIIGNKCLSTLAKYNIEETSSSATPNNLIVGNYVEGGVTGRILAKPGDHVYHNYGYNPVGAIASPFDNTNHIISPFTSGGASGPTASVTYTVKVCPVRLIITGGDNPLISIDGVNTGLGSGVYHLEPDETIKWGAFTRNAPTVSAYFM